jgi:hypothetical protein
MKRRMLGLDASSLGYGYWRRISWVVEVLKACFLVSGRSGLTVLGHVLGKGLITACRNQSVSPAMHRSTCIYMRTLLERCIHTCKYIQN